MANDDDDKICTPKAKAKNKNHKYYVYQTSIHKYVTHKHTHKKKLLN